MLGIVLTIIGFAAIIVFAIQAYKTAVSTERNAALWTAVTVLVGFLILFVIPFAIGVAIGIYYVFTVGDVTTLERDFGGYLTMVDILALIISIWAMGMVLKVVSRVKDDEPSGPIPPPPPTFDGGQ